MTQRWNNSFTYLHGGVLHAVREIRTYCRSNPGVTFEHAAEIRSAINSDIAAADFHTAVELLNRDPELAASRRTELDTVAREVLAHIIVREMPPWAQMIPYGRRPLIGKTREKESNIYQCFDYAELFGSDAETFKWWARMERHVRDAWQQENDDIGMRAEFLSFEFEIARLAREGHPGLEPRLESREDSRLGYDIESWDVSEGAPRRIYIEAKGCRKKPLSFHLSPNQWNVAKAKSKSWILHLWDVSDPVKPEVITFAQLEPHVPFNRGSGQWRNAQIAWPPKRTQSAQTGVVPN